MHLNEQLRLKYLHLFENFNKKSIPEELKYIASNVRPDLVKNGDNSFQKNYNFGSYKFNLIVNYKYGNKLPYFSNLKFSDVFNNPFSILDIPVEVQDIHIDINYLLSIITHEVRHIYDIFNIDSDYEVFDFYKNMQLSSYKGTEYQKFTSFIYLCLEHELIEIGRAHV